MLLLLLLKDTGLSYIETASFTTLNAKTKEEWEKEKGGNREEAEAENKSSCVDQNGDTGWRLQKLTGVGMLGPVSQLPFIQVRENQLRKSLF